MHVLYLLGGLCPGDLCSGGSLSRGSLFWRGLCPGGLHPGGLCPSGSLSRGLSAQGVSVQGSLSSGISVRETPPPVIRMTDTYLAPNFALQTVKINCPFTTSVSIDASVDA